MEKIFKIETVVKIKFENSGDYYEQIPLNFDMIKKDVLTGSRNFKYSIETDNELTTIQEI